jgi:hypothetical protein
VDCMLPEHFFLHAVFQTDEEKFVELKARHERRFKRLREELIELKGSSRNLAFHLEQKEIDEFIREW